MSLSAQPHLCRPWGARGAISRAVLLAACCLLAIPGRSAAGPDLKAVTETPEWRALAGLWHAMLDHSSNLIFNPTLFQELATDLDQADADIAALADRRLLPRAAADDLRRLFHSRCQYIRDRHYVNQAQITLTAAESARVTAQWLLELQLAVLRDAAAGPQPDRRLAAAAESNISYELTFLRHLDDFDTETQQRRQNLTAREDKGEKVDWQSFDNDCERRRSLLLEAYRQRRLRCPRSVRALMPYLLALTTSRPSAPAPTASSTSPSWETPDARLEH